MIYLKVRRKKYHVFNVVIIIQFFFTYCGEAIRCSIDENCTTTQATPIMKFSEFMMVGYIFAHWLYASQYIKTSLILPSLYKIASLLLKCQEANQTELAVKNT